MEKDGPEAFIRRRAVERKHGRVSMMAMVGVLIHNADIEFPGYLSITQKLKFSDIPNGFKGIFAVPPAGIAQILAFIALIELAWWPASNYSGDYGCGFFGTQYEGEEKITKLNAEMANGKESFVLSFILPQAASPCSASPARSSPRDRPA